MKKTLLILTALASLTMANSSRAALGWTLDECKQHWGEPVRSWAGDRTYYMFEFKNYIICVGFLHDKVSRAQYSRNVPDSLPSEEIQSILKVNAPSVVWPLKPDVKDDLGHKTYEWVATGVSAILEDNMLMVLTDKENEYTNKQREKNSSDL